MRKVITVFLLLCLLASSAEAASFTPPEVPEAAEEYMPEETDNFGEGLWFVITSAVDKLQPSFSEAIRTCVKMIAVALLVSLLSNVSQNVNKVITLLGTTAMGVLLFRPVNTLVDLGIQTVEQISQYGRLLLPVMTGLLAAQGGVTKSGTIYVTTACFDAVLSSLVSALLVPLIYVFLAFSVTCNLFHQPLIQQMQKFIKWLITWGLKIILYVFTGYIGITGVVSGTADAAMLKATKLTISGMVPVVGNILSDASEAVLVSTGVMKNAAGIYGILAVVALWIGPFLRIGTQYLLLKITSGTVEMFGQKQMAGMLKDYAGAMGIVLAMTGSVCLIFLISTICFMKGVS